MKALSILTNPRSVKRLGALSVALLTLALLPEHAHACPVCFDPDDEQRIVFLATTALMTAVPLGIIGGVGLWLRRRVKQVGEGDEETGS